MNSILPAILFMISGVLFFAAGCLAVRPLQMATNKPGWSLAIVTNLILVGAAGLRAYQEFIGPALVPLVELVIGGLAVLAAAIDIFSLANLAKQFLQSETNRSKAMDLAQRYLQSLEKSPQFIGIKDRQGVYQYANPAFLQLLGKQGQDLTGESDSKLFPRALANAYRVEEERAIETGAMRTRDEEIRGIDGLRWVRTSRVPILDEKLNFQGLLVTSNEITDQKQLEDVLKNLTADLAVLEEANQAIGNLEDLAAFWDGVMEWTGKIAGTEHVAIWQIYPERSLAAVKLGCGKLSSLVNIQVRAGEEMVWKVWQSGTAEIVNNYPDWPGRSQKLRDFGFQAAIAFPVRMKGQNVTVVTAYKDQPGALFRDDQLQLFKVYATQAVSRLEQIEKSAATQSEVEEWKRKQDTSNYRVRLEHIVAVIAAHFINPNPEKIDEGITRSLQTLCKFAGVDRGYVVLFPKESSLDLSAASWYGSGITAEVATDAMRDDFQWCLSKLNQLETIHIPRLKDGSIDTDEAAIFLRAKGIKSFTAVPLVQNRTAIGYLGFETLRSELEWSAEILALFKTCTEIFVSLLERKGSAKGHRDQLEQANRQIAVLEQRNQESSMLNEMGDLLQACRTSDEAYPIIVRYLKRLLPVASGALYMIHDPKDPADKVAAWGNDQPGPSENELAMNECWSLRRGRLYSVQDPSTEPVCGHIHEPLEQGYLCVPLVAQGVAVGVLHLRLPGRQAGEVRFSDTQQQLASKIGETIAVPLTNLKLRDDLRSQAIRDPLTKLFNRRYMEETLDREIRRAIRHSTSVGIIMFDIDKMKPINDRFGHDAGDLLLKSLGRELLGLFRGEDVACRYGGDEFTIVLPEASLADVWRRAEQMREAIKRLDLRYDGKPLGTLTLSIGVAAFPDHGSSAEKVLLACDAASYASKQEGGDRIMMGHKAEG